MSFTTRNHYVPEWYQRLFFEGSKQQLIYWDCAPEVFRNETGHIYRSKQWKTRGVSGCFKEDNLYTLFFGSLASDIIEKEFFGQIDNRGAPAVKFFCDYEWQKHTNQMGDLLRFMGAQKLRTPKGLAYIKKHWKCTTNVDTLQMMVNMTNMFQIMWREGVWEILHCDNSTTKFIISDHPVTMYNRGFFPSPHAHLKHEDPGIEMLGTQTIFPLSLNRCLVITNLGYVRDPEAPPTQIRENARISGRTIRENWAVQTKRQISEDDVIAINYIVKKRAFRFIAGARKEWLEPENQMKSRHWSKLGGRFFLRPDPRKTSFTSQWLVAFKGGEVWGMDEYGRRTSLSSERDEKQQKELGALQKSCRIWDKEFGPLSPEEHRSMMP